MNFKRLNINNKNIMKHLLRIMPMVAAAVLLVAGILLFAGCKEEEKETKEVKDKTSYMDIPLEQYLEGTWILEKEIPTLDYDFFQDTLIFNNGFFVSNCDMSEQIPYQTQHMYYPYNDTITKNDTTYYSRLFIERLGPDKILIYNYHPCYDLTCAIKNSTFNRIKI